MAGREFVLIDQYFKNIGVPRTDVHLGIGDDCACVVVPAGKALVSCTDTFVEGKHFLPETAAFDIGYKALAVNLSDMAAMGAVPQWVSLALCAPGLPEAWVKDFCAGMDRLLQAHQLSLIGGDLSQGHLTVTPFVEGIITPGQWLTRRGAKPGDTVFVTGKLGVAGMGLKALLGECTLPADLQAQAVAALHRPTPRLAVGQALVGIANSAIDISDGLLGDLQHMLDGSGVGADIELASLPTEPGLFTEQTEHDQWQHVLTAGDDYELCFTVPADKLSALAALPFDFIEIGRITTEVGALRCLKPDGEAQDFTQTSYQHFA